MNTTELNGIILVDKPAGWTSFDVVAKIRGAWRTELKTQELSPKKAKVGHTGTLDPFATGLMIVVLGAYCKRAQEFTKLDKTYEVTATLGHISTTGDPEGDITHTSDIQPTQLQIEQVLQQFTGTIQQIPPSFSAIKVNGQRAYDLARKGKEVTLEPRTVTIHAITDMQYTYPTLQFTADVSSGTYIRSLVSDIGKQLATGAYTSALRRTRVGQLSLEGAINPNAVTFNTLQAALQTVEAR